MKFIPEQRLRWILTFVLVSPTILFFAIGMSVLVEEPHRVRLQTLVVADIQHFSFTITPSGKPGPQSTVAPAGLVTFKDTTLTMLACDPCQRLPDDYQTALSYSAYVAAPVPATTQIEVGDVLNVYVPDEQGDWWFHPKAKGWCYLAGFFFLLITPLLLLFWAGHLPLIQRTKTLIVSLPFIGIFCYFAWEVLSAN
ncbi:MAG: hypothetical protein ACK4XG_10000 [Chromatiaceae bacterium]